MVSVITTNPSECQPPHFGFQPCPLPAASMTRVGQVTLALCILFFTEIWNYKKGEVSEYT